MLIKLASENSHTVVLHPPHEGKNRVQEVDCDVEEPPLMVNATEEAINPGERAKKANAPVLARTFEAQVF